MPRIPAALAVVATLAVCIGLNIAWYPAVWEMVAPGAGLAKAAAPDSAGMQPAIKAQDAAPLRAAYCTAGGICYTADGKSVPDKKQNSKAPDLAKTAPSPPPPPSSPASVAATPAAKVASEAVVASAAPTSVAKAGGEKGEKPAAKPEATNPAPAAAATATVKLAGVEKPIGPEKPLVPVVRPPAIKKPVERLPPAAQVAAMPASATATIPVDSIPIYPTTPAN